MGKRIAIYPDAFDPPCFGHLQMIRRAALVFDGILLYIEEREHSLISLEQRTAILREEFSDLTEIDIISGDFSPEEGNVYFLLRPLRKSGDLDAETLRAPFYHSRFPGLEVIYLPIDHWEAMLSGREAGILYPGLCRPEVFFPDGVIRCLSENKCSELSAKR